jgi:hypothetical protein
VTAVTDPWVLIPIVVVGVGCFVYLAVCSLSRRREGVPPRLEQIVRDHMRAEADQAMLRRDLDDMHDVFEEDR